MLSHNIKKPLAYSHVGFFQFLNALLNIPSSKHSLIKGFQQQTNRSRDRLPHLLCHTPNFI